MKVVNTSQIRLINSCSLDELCKIFNFSIGFAKIAIDSTISNFL